MFLRISILIIFALIGVKNDFIKNTSKPIVEKVSSLTSFFIKDTVPNAKGKTWKGIASFYHNKFHGRKTATGELFDQNKMTCANNFLPLGTQIKVTNLSNGKIIYVKVNDRLAKSNKRLIDLSKRAATELGFIDKGLQKVEIEVVNKIQDIESNEINEVVEKNEITKVEDFVEPVKKNTEPNKTKKERKKKISSKTTNNNDSIDLSSYNYISK